MTAPAFDTPMLRWIGQPNGAVPDYAALFGGTKPQIMGESPYLNGKEAGIALALSRVHHVEAIFLYAKGVEDFAQFAGMLPAGLTFTSPRAAVRAALGDPAMTAEPGGTGLFAIEFGFDRFEAGGFYARFEYEAGYVGIRLVTLGKVAG